MSSTPTVEQRQECKIRMLERRVRQQAHELRRLEAILVERKRMLEMLGYAWGTRGAATRAEALTLDEVKRLVAAVNRIQARHFNTEYRLMYDSLDEMLRKAAEASSKRWIEACGWNMASVRRAKRWKALAKKLRRASPDRGPAK